NAYVGGFVAVPFDNLVQRAKGDVTPVRLRGHTTLPNFPSKLTTSGFLKPVVGQDTLDITPINFATDHTIGSNKIGRRDGVGSKNPDGYHYFTTAHTDGTRYAYGGILSGTDLGAPVAISAQPLTATWDGYFSHSSDITDEDVKFFIDFEAGILGFANTAGNGTESKIFDGSSHAFRVDGKFGTLHNLATGQLGGTLTRGAGTDDTYIIRGLIGQEGAVAVFIDFDMHNAGGFTASEPDCDINPGPCVIDYADWGDGFDTAPAIAPNITAIENQFLQGTDTTLPTTGFTITGGAVTTLDLENATFDGVALGGQVADGVGFFTGIRIVGGGTANYAGIFNGTDLGEPLDAGSPKAYWNG
ncbi:MAG: hypothetical protein K8953_07915, partial [Proteobacteria bacterium]|nr:hypothetical protein [Pseudomonadota bacterium]